MLHKVDEVRSAHESSGTTCPDLSGQFARHQRPSHPISIAETPIGLVQAFRDAMEALDDLHQGRPEAALLYKGKPVSVRYLIEVASYSSMSGCRMIFTSACAWSLATVKNHRANCACERPFRFSGVSSSRHPG
jgi:hypothetical protein